MSASIRSRLFLLILATLPSAACSKGDAPRESTVQTRESRAIHVLSTLRGFVGLGDRVTARPALVSEGAQYRLATPELSGFVASSQLRTTLPTFARGSLHATTVGAEEVTIDVTSLGLADVKAVSHEGALVMTEVAPDTDLAWIAEADRVEEVRLLRSPKAPTTAEYGIHLGGNAKDARLTEGHVEILDARGRVRIASERAFAVDAHGVRRDLVLTLEREGEDFKLRVTLDPRGLAYPIAVDPAWVTTGVMKEPKRSFHTVTRLADGRVLAVGGNFITTDAEIYTPSTGAWTATKSMVTSRRIHTAVLLSSGKVLVAGGDDQSSPANDLSAAEVYDPTADTWTSVAPMLSYRLYAASTLLSSGKVLVTGGLGFDSLGTDKSSGAEIYDPTTNTWTAAASMSIARNECALVTLPSGKALAVGKSGAEVYDPAANTWTPASGTTTGGQWTATLLTGGKVLIGQTDKTALLYDPATNALTAAAAMLETRIGQAAAVLPGNRVLIAGGNDGAANLSTAEIYNATTNAWTSAGTMSTRRINARAVPLGTGAIVVGGSAVVTTVADVYAPYTIGAVCASGWECGSGFCVDARCCTTATCPAGQTCAGVAPGTCAKVNGSACTTPGECASGSCVDGYCCNVACGGQCEACDVTGFVGTCTAVSGAPHGSRTVCSGTGSGTSCGPTCNGSDRTKCNYPGSTTSCGTASCSAGIEKHVGTCDGAGACPDVPKTCTPYVCGSPTCKTTCAATADCVAGYYCSGTACVPVEGLGKDCKTASDCSTGFCTDGVCCGVGTCGAGSSCGITGKKGTCAKLPGSACTADGECGSDHCVDGVCCDTACAGQCEACDVTGKAGACTPVSGAPHGSRAKCSDGAGDVCLARVCDGAKDATKCVGFASDTTVKCKDAFCDVASFTGTSFCDGIGTCAPPAATSCVPYTCDDKGCRTSCTLPEHCSKGFVCEGGKCVKAVAKCSSDGSSAIDPDGKVTPCSPYRCKDGVCGNQCDSSSDCADGNLCDLDKKQCLPAGSPDGGTGPAEDASSGGCGCKSAPSSSSVPIEAFVLAGIALAIVRRARRRIRGSLAPLVMTLLLGCSSDERAPNGTPSARATTTSNAAEVIATIAQHRELGVHLARSERLVLDADTYRLPPATRALGLHYSGLALDARLPKKAGDSVHLGRRDLDGVWIELVDDTTNESVGELQDSAVVHVAIAPNVDLVRVLEPGRYEELRVLRGPGAPTTFRQSVRTGSGVASMRLRDGAIEVVDLAGAVRIRTERPFALDAHGTRRDVTLSIEGATLVQSFDGSGLAYPIVVDPVWVTAAVMKQTRTNYTTTLLTSGKVLVIGGSDPSTGGARSTAEIWDPATDTWTLVKSMSAARASHSAALLKDGRVLAAHGASTPSAEIYAPGTDTWTVAAAPASLAFGASAIVLSDGTVWTEVGRYDPSGDKWTAVASSSVPHWAFLPLGTKIAAFGASDATKGLEIYDPATNTWTFGAGMGAARVAVTGVLAPSGKLLAFGGTDLTSYFSTAEAYDPSSGTWSAIAPMSAQCTTRPAAVLTSGRVLMIGGTNEITRDNYAPEVYDPVTNTWAGPGAKVTAPYETLTAISGDRALLSSATSSQIFSPSLAGVACSGSFECTTGFCTEGVCCNKIACATTETCAGPGLKGTCAKKNGQACTAGTECASSNCVDGYCCNSACGGQCGACDVTGSIGTCVPVVGKPHGTRAACTGTGAGTTCGPACDGADTSACHFPLATATCGSDACASGIETHFAKCDGSGKCADVPKSCGAYVCGTTSCKTSCTSKADCAIGYFCSGSACVPSATLGKTCTSPSECDTGFCTDGVCCGEASCGAGRSCATPTKKGTCAKIDGTSCTSAAECGSGFCVDAVCCNVACGGQCEACDVSGKAGTCTPVSGGPHGDRPKCSTGGANVCAARACDGAKDTTLCVAYANGSDVECSPAACDVSTFQPAGQCDGAGTCKKGSSTSCGSYKCDAKGCLSSCTSSTDCATGFACRDGKCVTAQRTCSADNLTSYDAEGKPTACAPFLCRSDGTCGTGCGSSSECAPGNVCNVDSKTCVPSEDTGSSGGCGLAHERNDERRPWLVFASIAALALLHRKRR